MQALIPIRLQEVIDEEISQLALNAIGLGSCWYEPCPNTENFSAALGICSPAGSGNGSSAVPFSCKKIYIQYEHNISLVIDHKVWRKI